MPQPVLLQEQLLSVALPVKHPLRRLLSVRSRSGSRDGRKALPPQPHPSRANARNAFARRSIAAATVIWWSQRVCRRIDMRMPRGAKSFTVRGTHLIDCYVILDTVLVGQLSPAERPLQAERYE